MAPSPGEPTADGSYTQQTSFAIHPAHWSPVHVGLMTMGARFRHVGPRMSCQATTSDKRAHPADMLGAVCKTVSTDSAASQCV